MSKIFDEFPVYNLALEVTEECNKICKSINDNRFYYLKDQLRRAIASVVLNLAEGAGKWLKRDKCKFYRMSRASAYESIAAIDLFIANDLFNKTRAKILRDKLVKITKEIYSIIIAVEKRKD